eukprot:CAMPEP_0203954766 /NCGR_PEP_ID=MMETSP0359-20131031/87632_1 /ASSEMBLY_ACC=CAM_ASM_000338 /TAXON_ID=268821 /ORGANISM="Scrippsiella Hangoei, Strain SHTV-5" /LENGTH=239 /DNA_ID=CAMNT_0050888301 /DNA_START=45 /DNA_END=762 /DNA_ORIENTATION=+
MTSEAGQDGMLSSLPVALEVVGFEADGCSGPRSPGFPRRPNVAAAGSGPWRPSLKLRRAGSCWAVLGEQPGGFVGAAGLSRFRFSLPAQAKAELDGAAGFPAGASAAAASAGRAPFRRAPAGPSAGVAPRVGDTDPTGGTATFAGSDELDDDELLRSVLRDLDAFDAALSERTSDLHDITTKGVELQELFVVSKAEASRLLGQVAELEGSGAESTRSDWQAALEMTSCSLPPILAAEAP